MAFYTNIAISVTSTLLAACSIAPPTHDTPGPIKVGVANALWNDSGVNHDIGFWLYSKTGTCPSIRKTTDAPLVFSPPNTPGSTSITILPVQNMQYCFINSQAHIRCKDGEVNYTYFPSKREYHGTYSITFEDRKVLQGTFNAQYCPPRK